MSYFLRDSVIIDPGSRGSYRRGAWERLLLEICGNLMCFQYKAVLLLLLTSAFCHVKTLPGAVSGNPQQTDGCCFNMAVGVRFYHSVLLYSFLSVAYYYFYHGFRTSQRQNNSINKRRMMLKETERVFSSRERS